MHYARASRSYAGFVSRAVAFVVDAAVMSVTILVVVALFEAILGFFTWYGLFGRSGTVPGPIQAIVTAAIAIIAIAIAIGYPVGCWVLLGQTPGKALTGVRVIRMNGARLTLGRALLRYLGYWLSALPLFLGFLWILGDHQRRGWHDKLAGTCVIYTFELTSAPTEPLPGTAS